MIETYGKAALKNAMLPDVISMKSIMSYCLTEPGSGSDAAALTTKAAPFESGFELTGTKAFISGGGYSDAYIVMARTGADGPKGISAFVVNDGTHGLSFGALEDKMGWRAQPTRAVQMDGCKVPAENMFPGPASGPNPAWLPPSQYLLHACRPSWVQRSTYSSAGYCCCWAASIATPVS